MREWLDAYPGLLQDNENGKNPPDYATLDEAGGARVERAGQIYPKTSSATVEQVPSPFPILVDAYHTVSQGLGLFTTDWSGNDAEQNVPSVFIIDPPGGSSVQVHEPEHGRSAAPGIPGPGGGCDQPDRRFGGLSSDASAGAQEV